MEELKDSFYTTQVAVTTEEIKRIEQCTREQSGRELWKEERIKRITASNVGAISKMRKTTKRSGKEKELLYSTFTGSRATRLWHPYGRNSNTKVYNETAREWPFWFEDNTIWTCH